MPKTIHADVTAKAILAENQPVFLLELALDSGTLYLCDAAANVTFPTGGNLYLAHGFSFDGVQNTLTGEVDRATFSFDNANLSFRAYTDADEFQGRRLTLRRIFADLLGSADYSVVLFTGMMQAPDVTDRMVSVTVNSPLSALDGTIPRRRYQNNCHWIFDSTECKGGGASLAGEVTGAIADAESTASILVDAARSEAADYWLYGTVTMTDGTAANIGEVRPISISAVGQLTLLYPMPAAIAAGDEYTIRRGCNKTSAWCSVKHSNWTNFGGYVGLPQRRA
jgi:hypothetical protein